MLVLKKSGLYHSGEMNAAAAVGAASCGSLHGLCLVRNCLRVNYKIII